MQYSVIRISFSANKLLSFQYELLTSTKVAICSISLTVAIVVIIHF